MNKLNLESLYAKIMSIRNDDDYVVNQPQMDKLNEAIAFFADAAKKNDGSIDPINLYPCEEHGGVTAKFLIFDVYGEETQEFAKIVSYTSALSIDPTKEGIAISITIPNVFVKKEN